MPTDQMHPVPAAAANQGFIVTAYRRVTANADDTRYVCVGYVVLDSATYRSIVLDTTTGEASAYQLEPAVSQAAKYNRGNRITAGFADAVNTAIHRRLTALGR